MSVPLATTSEMNTVRISANKLDTLFVQAEEMLTVKLSLTEKIEDFNELRNDINLARKEWEKIVLLKKKENLKLGLRSKENKKSITEKLSETTGQEELFTLGEHQLKALKEKVSHLANNFEIDLHNFSVKLDNFLEDTKKIFMWPFSTLLNIFPKIVRDISRKLNKEVNLTIEGAEIEIDKRILEELKDVIMHLLRNAIDHGIELPEERKRFHKPSEGHLSIIVQQLSGNEIIIEIKDDGAGIDLGLVKKAAIKKGIINQEIEKNLSNEQAIELIFQSGISTSPIISDLSGRGLGMAIIREKIEKVSGNISIDTKPGQGTTITIRLPLSIATFKGTLVKISDQYFIIPTSNLERIIRIKKDKINKVENRESINYQGKNLSLVWLCDLLGLSKINKNDDEYLVIAIVVNSNKRIAFILDEFFNEHEIIVKNFTKPLLKVPNISAATILGTGKPIPILNTSDLLHAAQISTLNPVMNSSQNIGKDIKHILLVEDSITTRNLLKNILEMAGFQVTTAVDGMEAWNLVKINQYSIIVSDVDMPNMNGFELTEKIKKDAVHSTLPIILVTARESTSR